MSFSSRVWVRCWWQGEAGVAGAVLSILTLPVELLFRIGVTIRGLFYRVGWLKAHRAPLPVISVGNLSVGGTGKTPLSAWIARELAEAGANPAILSRGYGRDELLLHRRWNPQVPTYADADRVVAAERARQDGATVVVLDDGFQHRRIHRDLDLVLLSADEPLPGRLLPRGPFREPMSALGRADMVLITMKPGSEEAARTVEREVRALVRDVPVSILRLEAGSWQDLDGEAVTPPTPPVIALSGVAKPDRFTAMVEGLLGGEVMPLAYPDHHEYSSEDILSITTAAGERTVVTTEKDAVKLRELQPSLPRVRVLTMDVRLDEEGSALREALRSVAEGERE